MIAWCPIVIVIAGSGSPESMNLVSYGSVKTHVLVSLSFSQH
jgi:hypothetical protein